MDTTTAEKFEKILNLMDKAGSEGEAQAAAAAFQRLLIKHGVDEMEARRAAGTTNQTEKPVVRWVTLTTPRSHETAFLATLLTTVTHFSFCKAYSRGTRDRMMVMGRPSDIVNAMHFFDRTAATFRRLAEQEVARAKIEYARAGYRMPNAGSWKRDFLLGACSGLWDKLEADRMELLRNEEGSSALVVVRDDELKAAERELIGKVRSVKGDRATGGDAWSNGYKAGRNHSDHKEVGKGSLALHG